MIDDGRPADLENKPVDPAALAKEVDVKPKPPNYYGTMVGVVKKALKEWDEWRIEEEEREAAEAERQAEAAHARGQAGAGTVEEDGTGTVSGQQEIGDGKALPGKIHAFPASPSSNVFANKRGSSKSASRPGRRGKAPSSATEPLVLRQS